MINYVRLINKTEDYIENNLTEKITLTELANNVNVSKYYYHHIFRENCNETIKEYVTRIKMERSAIYLVVNQSLPITDIALNYGYSDSSSYNNNRVI
jgi:AraC family transcriptional regulator